MTVSCIIFRLLNYKELKMADKKAKSPKKISRKKRVYLEIVQSLSASLTGLKDILGEKKFETRVRKAAKLLSTGLKSKKKKAKATPKKNKSAIVKEPEELPGIA